MFLKREGGGGGQAPRLKDAIDRFTRDALAWIKAHFGNIFTKKKNIKARLNGIQQAVSVKPSNFLFNLENELLKKLENVLSQEEELWALKSRESTG